MTDAIAGLDPVLKFIIVLGGAVAAVATFVKWWLPKWRRLRAIGTQMVDTIIGREAGVDSITGRPVPEVPGIGARMSDQEQDVRGIRNDVGVLTRAVADLASAQADMTAIQSRIDDHDRRISDNDRRLTAIEQGHHLERMAGKAESIHLYRAIESIAKDENPTDPDDVA